MFSCWRQKSFKKRILDYIHSICSNNNEARQHNSTDRQTDRQATGVVGPYGVRKKMAPRAHTRDARASFVLLMAARLRCIFNLPNIERRLCSKMFSSALLRAASRRPVVASSIAARMMAARVASFSSDSHDDFAPKRKTVGDEDEAIQLIKEHVESNPVMLYMKGNPSMPMCGFSARVVGVLQEEGVDFR